MKLVKLFAESVSLADNNLNQRAYLYLKGAAAIHMEDQLHGGKKVMTMV